MNQKAKDYIRRNTLDLESDNRMDSTGYVQYAISEAKAYAAIAIAEEGMRQILTTERSGTTMLQRFRHKGWLR